MHTERIRSGRRRTRRWPVASLAVALVLGACGGGETAAPAGPPGSAGTVPGTAAGGTAEPGTTVDISSLALRPIPAGAGVAQGSAVPGDGTDALPGYEEHELLLGGLASTYSGPATGPAVEATTGHGYMTRLLVRAPDDPSRFSGRVFVEPLNTSGGADAAVVWAQAAPLLMAEGDAWVGVTVRASSVTKLHELDPVRYADLALPSNDLEWDVLRQLGTALQVGDDDSPLAALPVEHVYLGGYSQSGIDVATFALAFNGSTRLDDGSAVYDGYLPAAHSGSLAPLQSGSAVLPTFEYEPMTAVDVPVLDLETQSDVEGFTAEIDATTSYTSHGSGQLRRPDSDTDTDRYRLWEVAGAPHAAAIPGCDGPPSSFPTEAFVRGAIGALYAWAEDGTAPTSAARIDLAEVDVVSVSALDADGNARGGVRSPFVDAPLVRYEVHSTPGALCQLSSRETALDPAELRDRYGDVAGYQRRFGDRLDDAIGAGFLLELDRASLLEGAQQRAAAVLPAA